MKTFITDQDRAKLHAKFILPIVVDNMLQDQETLDDVAEYAMNEILSELCPDTALLCIGLCATHIAAHTAHLPISRALSSQAEAIIEEYGGLWLAHDTGTPMDPAAICDQLSCIPEDLEALRDLLEATISALEESHSIAAILCDILALQAETHCQLATIELEQMNIRPPNNKQKRPHSAVPAATTDNIIPFPHYARSQ